VAIPPAIIRIFATYDAWLSRIRVARVRGPDAATPRLSNFSRLWIEAVRRGGDPLRASARTFTICAAGND